LVEAVGGLGGGFGDAVVEGAAELAGFVEAAEVLGDESVEGAGDAAELVVAVDGEQFGERGGAVVEVEFFELEDEAVDGLAEPMVGEEEQGADEGAESAPEWELVVAEVGFEHAEEGAAEGCEEDQEGSFGALGGVVPGAGAWRCGHGG
jgi:hypothetical protein